jgi:hypothetical protein
MNIAKKTSVCWFIMRYSWVFLSVLATVLLEFYRERADPTANRVNVVEDQLRSAEQGCRRSIDRVCFKSVR